MQSPFHLRTTRLALWGGAAALAAVPSHAGTLADSAQTFGSNAGIQSLQIEPASAASPQSSQYDTFEPSDNPVRHRIVYDVFDFALQNIVISMGPSNRSKPYEPRVFLGTRIRQGHNSRFRLEGSMVGFSFFDKQVIESFTTYREELQAIGDTIPIRTLPRDEQLAYWFNLHNVAMLEQIGQRWPMRQPRSITIDGVPLDDAKFITVEGVSLSLRDIREKIVFRHWKNPKVIYGFWRGEIGAPALQPSAFNSTDISWMLDFAAIEFINSLRGTEKRGGTLHVSKLYEEVARFYFTDFDADLRAHIANYAEDEVEKILAKTDAVRASIKEHDIADLSGGSRGANYLAGSATGSRPGIPPGMIDLLRQRQLKFDVQRRRKKQRTGRVFFSNIALPGDPPNKNAVE